MGKGSAACGGRQDSGKVRQVIDFVDFIASMAAEDETALIGLQKPLKGKEGKYAFIAQRPSDPRPEGKAWYMNTGCFIEEKFKGGKVQASISKVSGVLCMMLDDIGTKAKAPPLEPTWIIETSPDNYQWGYVFDFNHQPHKADYVAALLAIADAGYTDPGAGNPVRWFRIPGSVNLKPERNGFVSRLVEFEPERQFTLDEIIKGFGVTPGEARLTDHVTLKDDGQDDVLAWLEERGEVHGHVSAEGWVEVTCPNHKDHTSPGITAGYLPATRAFKCLHGHCVGLNSRVYLDWVAAHGGPRQCPGPRAELIAGAYASALSKLPATGPLVEAAQASLATDRHKEIQRAERADWFTRYAWLADKNNSFYDLEARDIVYRHVFDSMYAHVPCRDVDTGRKCAASTWFDQNREAADSITLAGLTYAAGEGMLVWRNGRIYGNLWIDRRPDVSSIVDPQVDVWLAHVERMVPDPVQREHVLNVMASRVQQPRIKVNHAILHGGLEGSGKDAMWKPFFWAISGDTGQNRAEYKHDEGNSKKWGYAYESEVLVLNELRESDTASRRAMANRLKPLIAAPPDFLEVEKKGRDPYEVANRLWVMAFTNHTIPISISGQDRRWFCIWSDAPRMTVEEAGDLWGWYAQGGLQQVAAWLHQRDISGFVATAIPGSTDWKSAMIEDSMSAIEGTVVELIKARSGVFQPGFLAAPLHKTCDLLGAQLNKPVHPQALAHALQEMGWIEHKRLVAAGFPTSKRVWISPDCALSKSDIRRQLDPGA